MVNVNDFSNELPKGDLLVAIFDRQRELIKKYHEIEKANLGFDFPMGLDGMNVHDRVSQIRFKDFAWRITEELTEATECMYDEDNTHFLEELIDALHFYVELMVYSGLGPAKIKDASISPDGDLLHFLLDNQDVTGHNTRQLVYNTIEELGKAMNCLKNKPWKQTPMITDEATYKWKLVNSFMMFFGVLKAVGFSAEELVLLYLNKSDVNRFRIRSAY